MQILYFLCNATAYVSNLSSGGLYIFSFLWKLLYCCHNRLSLFVYIVCMWVPLLLYCCALVPMICIIGDLAMTS